MALTLLDVEATGMEWDVRWIWLGYSGLDDTGHDDLRLKKGLVSMLRICIYLNIRWATRLHVKGGLWSLVAGVGHEF